MNPKHIAILLTVVVATTGAGIGIVSAAHEPADPENVYIHKVEAVVQGPDAQICIYEMGPDVNKVVIEGETTHTNTTFFHNGEDGDVRIHVPRLNVPEGHKIVLFSNGENPTIDNAATSAGTCTAPGTDVTSTLVIGEYNINVGTITLTEGVEVVAGPNVSDGAPAPGSGGASLGLGADSSSSTSPLRPNGTDDVLDPDASDRPGPDLDEPDQVTNDTTENVSDTVEDAVDEPTDEADTIVEHVQETVDEAVDSILGEEPGSPDATDEFTDSAATDGGNGGSDGAGAGPGPLRGASGLTGAFGLTGSVALVGLLFGYIRFWSR